MGKISPEQTAVQKGNATIDQVFLLCVTMGLGKYYNTLFITHDFLIYQKLWI